VKAIDNANDDPIILANLRKHRTLIVWHIISLLAGMSCFIASAVLAGIYGFEEGLARNVVVSLLSVLAVLVEVVLHFVADRQAKMNDLSTLIMESAPNATRLSRRQVAIMKRVDTLFLIIMGTGK
jgi:hypothetical protein